MRFKSLVLGLMFLVGVLPVSGAEAQYEINPLYSKKSPIHRSVLKGRPAVKALLKFGTPVNTIDQYKMTLLHYAAWVDSPGLVRFLLRKGATIDAAGYSKRTPLHYAVEYNTYRTGKKSAIKTLLKHGANVAAQDTRGNTPLHEAVRERHEAKVELLLKYAVKNDMDIDVLGHYPGYTPLHEAVKVSTKTIVELLLEAGADTEVADDNFGWTPLHIAAYWKPEYVELLIKYEADVNARTVLHGETPLDKVVRASNSWGNTAYARAAELLKKAGAKHSPNFALVVGGK